VLTLVASGAALVAGVAFVLMTFPRARQFGASLLASAGVAGLVVGIAARSVVGNLLAGLEIALAQPMRIDDVLIVEGEWGRVEEIRATYVVLRLWDERRLIVPLGWFTDHPFQNWTRRSADILGTVMLWADYTLPVQALRAEAQRLCERSSHWDRRVCVVQVTDANERAMQLRILVSASSSGAAFDLRCELREGLKLNLVKIPIAPKDINDLATPFERAITPKTKLILIAHEINITGQIMPVRRVCEMARKRGIETIVDGAHSFAQFDFKRDDLQCDYFGTSLHKWLYAPKGTGMLYVRREKIPKIWALMASEDKNKNDIRKFEEIGTHSAAMRLAIGEAILFHNAIGGKRKEARLRFLSRYWMNKLKDVPKIGFNTSFDDAQSCAIANVRIEGVSPSEIGDYLMAKHKIFSTPIVHEEFTGIRITPNVYTTLWELDRFCEVMEMIARKGLPKA